MAYMLLTPSPYITPTDEGLLFVCAEFAPEPLAVPKAKPLHAG